MRRDITTGRVTIGLVQINNSFSNQNYLPLSVGMLQAYAQQHLPQPDRYEFLLPVYARIPVEQAVAQLASADIVLFSVYVWNIRISLEVAKALKQRRPEAIVVFGGPHVPERPAQNEAFMRQHPFIDVACIGEGEQVVVKILEQMEGRDWSMVPSVSFLAPDGQHVLTPRGPRLGDLSHVPSPYLAGTFDSLMVAHPNERWIALWETNRGCPFSCTFCDWGSATQAKVYQFDLDRLYREVGWFADRRIEFVFCCDANFGMLPRDLDIAAHVAQVKQRRRYPQALSVQNTKNATERAYQVQKILSDAGLNKGVDIALQSVDPQTLASIKRNNISTETYQELQRRFTRDGVETYTDLILGLPGETYESFVEGVSRCIENGQHNRIQFNNLSILPNAEMGDPDYQRRYGMETIETKVVNIHGALEETEGEVAENQVLVIATATMPRPEWVRTRAFAWMAALLHFDKVLQIPFVVLHEVCGVRYRELIELFLTQPTTAEFPILTTIREAFLAKAADIQRGGPEYCQSTEWLRIWWPADEYQLIALCYEGRLTDFYGEAERLLQRFLKEKFVTGPSDLLHAAVHCNQQLLKQPFQTTDLTVELPYNLWELYRAAVRGQSIPLEKRPTRHTLDRTSNAWFSWDDWCREVIWYGNKKGAYLYGNTIPGVELAGHY